MSVYVAPLGQESLATRRRRREHNGRCLHEVPEGFHPAFCISPIDQLQTNVYLMVKEINVSRAGMKETRSSYSNSQNRCEGSLSASYRSASHIKR